MRSKASRFIPLIGMIGWILSVSSCGRSAGPAGVGMAGWPALCNLGPVRCLGGGADPSSARGTPSSDTQRKLSSDTTSSCPNGLPPDAHGIILNDPNIKLSAVRVDGRAPLTIHRVDPIGGPGKTSDAAAAHAQESVQQVIRHPDAHRVTISDPNTEISEETVNVCPKLTITDVPPIRRQDAQLDAAHGKDSGRIVIHPAVVQPAAERVMIQDPHTNLSEVLLEGRPELTSHGVDPIRGPGAILDGPSGKAPAPYRRDGLVRRGR